MAHDPCAVSPSPPLLLREPLGDYLKLLELCGFLKRKEGNQEKQEWPGKPIPAPTGFDPALFQL